MSALIFCIALASLKVQDTIAQTKRIFSFAQANENFFLN